MPKTKSAQKSARAAEKKRQRNRAISSATKTYVSKAEKLISGGELDAAKEAAKQAQESLDKAAQKGVIHSNNAARRKSRLMKKLNASIAKASATV